MSKSNQAGFTLIELMVVLVVMGALVSAALPSIGGGFADRRVAVVAREVVSLFRRARYMSSAYGRAHQVIYEPGGGAGLTQPFVFETLRGTAGTCSLSTFESGNNQPQDTNCGDATHWRCVDSLYPQTHDPNPDDNDLVRVQGQRATFCYEHGSNNQVLVDNATLFSDWSGNAQAGFGFAVFRELDGNAIGVVRKVFVPTGVGAPRIMR